MHVLSRNQICGRDWTEGGVLPFLPARNEWGERRREGLSEPTSLLSPTLSSLGGRRGSETALQTFKGNQVHSPKTENGDFPFSLPPPCWFRFVPCPETVP